MAFQFHPIALGFMVVVAVGTVVYTLWNSRQSQYGYYERGNNNSYTSNYDCLELPINKEDDETKRKKVKPCDKCSICLETLKGQLKALTCTHIFHAYCIKKWLGKKNSCPVCRKVPQTV